jgi:hypothetical protein
MNQIRKFLLPIPGDKRLRRRLVEFFGYRPDLVIWDVERFSECGQWVIHSTWGSKEEALEVKLR